MVSDLIRSRSHLRPIFPRSLSALSPQPRGASQETSIKLGCGCGPLAAAKTRSGTRGAGGEQQEDRFGSRAGILGGDREKYRRREPQTIQGYLVECFSSVDQLTTT